MSGNGGGGGNGPTNGGPQNGECPKIFPDINLASTKENVLSRLQKGSQLELKEVDVEGRPSLRALYEGEEAGAIISNAARIIECMKNHRYIAVVTEIDGGSCIVQVRMDG